MDKNIIKDAIYKERPYFTLDTFIEMILYIFKNEQNVELLKYIIANKDKFSQQNILDATKILNEETKS